MTRHLDTPGTRLYKARPLLVAVAMLLASTARGDMVNGVQLPDSAQKVAERRYRTAQSYEETLKYYKSVYPPASYPRKAIINQPGIKAVHISNPSGRNFEGLNIYEGNDEVRIFIVAAPEQKQQPKKKGKK